MRSRVHRAAMPLMGALLLVGFAAPALADDFDFDGSGWGHGIGMSQYGSQAMALDGWTAEDIVTYYYTGTTVQALSSLAATWIDDDPAPLWVGVDLANTTLAFKTKGGGGTACHSATSPCPGGKSLAIAPDDAWEFRVESPGVCRFYKEGGAVGSAGGCDAWVSWNGQAGTTVDLSSAYEYRWGTLHFRSPDGETFHAVIRLTVDQFVRGLKESIPGWPAAALEAQALAGRSFAVFAMLGAGPESSFSDYRKNLCWCHQRALLDQAYKGWTGESQMGQSWVDAVAATAGEVITHPDPTYTKNGVIQAFYSSSSGGGTEDNNWVWGSPSRPYLQSVPDPWSLDPINPNAHWSHVESAAAIAADFGFDTVHRVWVTERNPSGSAKTVRFEGFVAGVFTAAFKTGPQTRSMFGLKSTTFSPCRERGPFDDDGCSFFEPNIVNIANAGFVDGGGDYLPDDPMTRASMAEFLARGLGLPESSTDHFSDDNGIPEEGYINSLADAGITIGYLDGTYQPANTVNRGEMAVYLSRAMGEFDPPLPGADPFPDVPADSWMGPFVAFIFGEAVTTGYMDGTYGPYLGTTRGEMAAFVDRALLDGH